MGETITSNASHGGLSENIGLDLGMSMEQREFFDLKITKLTKATWQREDLSILLKQLMNEQGRPRYSVENRIIISFDRSISSDIKFLRLNRDKLIEVLLNIAYNPYSFTYWLSEYRCWVAFALIQNYRRSDEYHEHPLGSGLREPDKAEFANELIKEIEAKSGGIIKANPNPKEHGRDGSIPIDREKLSPAPTTLVSYELLRAPVCDYGAADIAKDLDWQNCLPCPLYKDRHCTSKGAAIQRAIYRNNE